MENVERNLALHIIHTGTEHWKSLGRLILYLKVKETKGIAIKNPKVLKAVIFCDSDYSMDKEKGKSVRGIVATLGGTILTCLSKSHRMVTLSSIEADCVVLSAFSQKVKFVNVSLEEITEIQNP